MPDGLKNSGLYTGIGILPFIAAICIHCMHILVCIFILYLSFLFFNFNNLVFSFKNFFFYFLKIQSEIMVKVTLLCKEYCIKSQHLFTRHRKMFENLIYKRLNFYSKHNLLCSHQFFLKNFDTSNAILQLLGNIYDSLNNNNNQTIFFGLV